ncbi:MAG: fibronectin type III domain-containing protein, partial [Clostridia bacterium]|nr:fibronectin type III domain-containing protein [Clostridia bacterium]
KGAVGTKITVNEDVTVTAQWKDEGEPTPETCTVSFDANGGTGTMPASTVYQGESVVLPKCKFTPPAGLSFQAWKIGNAEYKKYASYTPTGNVTAKAVWTDKYIRTSQATMKPASLSNAICANDLVFKSLEPSKYAVSLWRVFDLTDNSLNTANGQYPKNVKFVSGHKYAIEFKFTAAGSYYEYDETVNYSTFYLNGKSTAISAATSISGSTLRRVELTANEQTITQVAATVTKPVAGNLPNNPPVISTADVTFGAYDWFENGNMISKNYDSFQPGHTYRLKIRANTVKTFSDAVTATINGSVATIESVSNNSLLFSIDFTLPGGSYTVTFNADGGTGNMAPVTGVSGNYTLPSCGFTAPAGKQFKCWVVGGVETKPYNYVNIIANTIVTAVWVDKPHEHQYTLKHNADYHWQECSCGQKVSYEEHIYDNETDATCNVCGYVRVAPHTHQYTLKHNADYHWQECSCGQKVSFAEHDPVQTVVKASAYATGYTESKCKVCQYIISRSKFTAPTGKVTGFKCAARTQAAEKLIWNKVPASVTGYQIQISNAAGTAWGKAYATAGNYYLFKNLSAGSNYKFRIRFFVKTPEGNKFSPWSAVASPTLPAATTVKLTTAKKTFSAQWSKKAVTGYQLQYSTKASFAGAKPYTIKNAKTYKYTFKNLKAKTTYYVRIRTYKTIAGVNYFSAWSATAKVKTK